MKKRVISLWLIFCILLSMAAQDIGYVWAAKNPPAAVSVTYEGSEITDITVPKNEKKTVTAVGNSSGEEDACQWQILTDIDTEQWVDIYGQDSDSLSLSYAMLSGVMDSKSTAYVRCKVTVEDQEVFSKPLLVTIAAPTPPPDLYARLNLPVPEAPEAPPVQDSMTSSAETTTEAPAALTETITEAPAEEAPAAVAKTMVEAPAEEVPAAPAKTIMEAPAEEAPAALTETIMEAPKEEAPAALAKTTAETPTEAPTETITEVPTIPPEAPAAPPEAPLAPPEAPAAEEPDVEYVYITVNYIDAISGNQLFGSHTSKIQKGTLFAEQVHSPTILGYAPYYYSDEWAMAYEDITDPAENANAKSAETLNFGTMLAGAVTDNITVNVYYWAVEVSYAIRYYFQNVNDDNYTEDAGRYFVGKAKTGTVIADEVFTEHAGNTDGFSPLYHYPQAVAADGSTVFECYYDRNYYFMKFDLEGGHGVDPIYARYDTALVVNTPTRPGYTFQFWDKQKLNLDGSLIPGSGDNVKDDIPARIPMENQYYQAIWEIADTSYTVIYWLENANDDGYSYLGYNIYDAEAEETVTVNTDLKDAIGVKDDPARQATLRFFELNQEQSDSTIHIKGDGSSVANVYYDRKEYTLKYYYAREYTNKGTTHYQICGNTSSFSDEDRDGDGTTDIADLFSNVNGNWSDVTKIPALKNDKGYYKTGTEQIRHNNTDYTYHYFTVTGKYGCDLTDEWPIEALETANLSQNINGTKNAYFSAWNPEHHIYYAQHAKEEFNGNRTIKGRFQKLDRRILYDSRFDTDSYNGEVRFLAFWTNALSNQTWTKSRKWIYNIYLQDVDGNMPSSPSESIVTYDTNEAPNEQTVPSIVGFTHTETTSRLNIETFDNNCKVHEMNFYFKRTNYSVNFYNNGVIMEGQQYDRPYGFKIGDTIMGLVENGTACPPYPDVFESNAYYFEGWYTTADCADGSGFIRRYTADGEWKMGKAYYNEMDAANLILYAHWVPLSHDVRFFLNYGDMLAYQENSDENLVLTTKTNGVDNNKVFTRPHGNVVGIVDFPTYKENGQDMTFTGWFYIKDGVKTMFTPADMPVRQDLLVFADWSSQTPQPFCIQYMKYGTNEKIADDTFGYAYQGTTRTFTPKIGSQLYSGFENGWFPTLSSHSITIKLEKDKDNPKINVYTFYYVQAEKIPFMVRYVDKNTGNELLPPVKYKDNTNAVVTERFVPIENYVSDAFYKRLVLAVKLDENGKNITKPEDNVITFYYYTPAEETTFYAVHHMLQKPGTDSNEPDSYVESDFITEQTGKISEEIKVTPNNFAGYTVTDKAVVVHGSENASSDHLTLTDGKFTFTLDEKGSELYIYYTLNQYPYTVKYLLNNTTTSVKDDKIVSGTEYGTSVTEDAEEIAGYTALDPTRKSLTIQHYEEDQGKENPNVIIFYYVPKTYIAEYKVADGGGKLDNYGGKAVADENGEYHFNGSLPVPDPGFEFAGWYTDKDCENSVQSDWVNEDNRLIPKIEGMKPEPETNTYYAKFRELKGDFTITRSNAENEGKGSQVFVYKVQNKDDPSLIIYVSITGEGSKTIHGLRYGNYIVEQADNWSWRYPKAVQEVEHKDKTTVNFNQSADQQQWLNGNSAVKVNKRGNNP